MLLALIIGAAAVVAFMCSFAMFKENDPEGIAFQYEVLGDEAPPAILIDTRD
jgi:hypothetical protein